MIYFWQFSLTRPITTPDKLSQILSLDEIKDHGTLGYINKETTRIDIKNLIDTCINRVQVEQDQIKIEINAPHFRTHISSILSLQIHEKNISPTYIIHHEFITRRSYKGTIILQPKNDTHNPLDLPPQQIKNLVRGIAWRDEHFAGATMKDIADREGLTKGGVRKIIMQSFDTLQSL